MQPRVSEILFSSSQLALCLIVAVATSTRGGENWTSYRGPTNQGYADGADLPVTWSESRNIAWKTPVPGKAWSSPVIWDDRIWLTNAGEDGAHLSVVCVDKNSGKIVLRKRLRYVVAPQYCNPFNSYASPSPVVEQRRVYVSFGSPYNACLDSKTGEPIWERTDFVCYHFRGGDFSASPILANGKIYFFDQNGKSTVIKAAPRYQVIAENQLDEGLMASPAVSGNALYVRTKTHLYRIEEEL